ncbi:BORG1 protein, partial [Tricholaema leucomelas]|nr:BORG1 protein [Tricholaema leucomelas]
MSTKVPIYLKRGSRKGKKEKLRDLLSSELISPPLGDFRHTIHVGSGGQGDTFGDISFLQDKLHLLPRRNQSGHSSELAPLEFSRSSSTISGHRCQPPLPAEASSSPLLKNAISLPIIGGPQALTLPSCQAPPKPPRLHLEEQEEGSSLALPSSSSSSSSSSAPPLSASKANGSEGQQQEEEEEEAEAAFLSQAGSLLSLHVDLGPSILEEVLQVMEK